MGNDFLGVRVTREIRMRRVLGNQLFTRDGLHLTGIEQQPWTDIHMSIGNIIYLNYLCWEMLDMSQ